MQLTEAQEKAIGAAERDLVIVAGAGSGKTFVLTEIACRLLQEHQVSPEQLAVITFTEKAARELRERIQVRLGAEEDFLARCSIGTIHSFAADLLRRFKSDLPPSFVIWDENRAALERSRVVHETLESWLHSPPDSLARLLDEYGWRRLRQFLSTHLGSRWQLNRVSGLQTSSTLWQDYQELYGQLAARYREYKRRQGVLDFEDLEEELLRLLQQETYRSHCQQAFCHLLVDEYQDTSHNQHEIIRKLHEPGQNHLVLVGDPLQSIYRFRGAEPELFYRAREEHREAGALEVDLRINFRSTPSLVETLNQIFMSLFAEGYHPMTGVKEDASMSTLEILSLPKVRTLTERRASEATQVADRIEQLLKEGRCASDFAILFRTRSAMAAYEEELAERGLPFQGGGGCRLLEQQEILDQLQLFRVLCRPEDRLAWVGLLRSPLGGITDEMIWQLQDKKKPEGLTTEEQRCWDNFDTWWQQLAAEAPHLKAFEIAQRSFLRFRSNAFHASGQSRSNLLQWIAWLEWVESTDPFSLSEILELVETLRSDQARLMELSPPVTDRETISLLTVHGAKGLEFPIVVVADLTASIRTSSDALLLDREAGIGMRTRDREVLGLQDRLQEGEEYQRVKKEAHEKDLEESKRLLYVACTRAQECLILPLVTDRKKKGNNWNDWLCSENLSGIGATGKS